MSDQENQPDMKGFEQAREYEQLHELVLRTLEDSEAPERGELASRLEGDIEAQDLYIEYIQDTAVLRAHALCKVTDDEPASLQPRNAGAEALLVKSFEAGRNTRFWMTLAAGVAFLVGGSVLSRLFPDSGGHASEIATVVRVTNVAWKGEHDPGLRPLTRVSSGQALDFKSGQLELVFDTGVELLITGPATMSIESPLRVEASRGAYTARVGERGKGFTIDTPATSVTDLGTEFGVSIQGDEETGVVVFDGSVDVTPAERDAGQLKAPPIRLTQGEALAVSRGGSTHRIVTMFPGQYPTVAGRPGSGVGGESLFAGVDDNLSDLGTKKFYRIIPRGFREDSPAFVDRAHEWNGIDQDGLPGFLVGGDYVMPFNDDKFLDGLEVTVRMRAACDLYVLFDKNMAVPEWLEDRFNDTGFTVGLDHGPGPFTKDASTKVGPGEGIDDRFSVWVRRVDRAEAVVLGGAAMPTDKELGWNMFGMVAVPLLDAEDAT